MKQDPNKQQHHTFGGSRAAETLKKEIDKGARYRTAVAILNKGQNLANVLMYAFPIVGVNNQSGKYFLQLLRKDIIEKIDKCSSDKIVKSLCRNIFTTKYRSLLKLSMFK